MRLVVFSWCRTSVAEAFERAGAHVVEVVTGSTCRDVNDPGFVERMRGLELDLLVVSGCNQKLREPIRRVARLGAVNFHPSLLPHYRAREPLFWTMPRRRKARRHHGARHDRRDRRGTDLVSA